LRVIPDLIGDPLIVDSRLRGNDRYKYKVQRGTKGTVLFYPHYSLNIGFAVAKMMVYLFLILTYKSLTNIVFEREPSPLGLGIK